MVPRCVWSPSWSCSSPCFQLGGSRSASANARWRRGAPLLVADGRGAHVAQPTGEVLSIDGFRLRPNSSDSGTLDRDVPASRTAGTCSASGHIQLADGRTMIVGGHIDAYVGLEDTTLFNPVGDGIHAGPDMAEGRWYPTATQLADGRVLTFAGDNIVQDRPGQPHSVRGRVGQLASRDLQPEDQQLDRPHEREADDAALPVHVRALERPGLQRRPGHDKAYPRPRDMDLVDGRRPARSTA